MRKSTYDRIMLRRQTGLLWLEADRYEESDPKRRFKLLRKMVRDGHNDGGLLQNLANAFAEGEGIEPNRLQALRWNRKSWRRGSKIAACNAAIDARLDGRYALAVVWFRRAIAMGDVDALLHLAKLLLPRTNQRAETMALLERRIAAGPQEIYEFPVADGKMRLIEDEDFAEAKRLLEELEGGSIG